MKGILYGRANTCQMRHCGEELRIIISTKIKDLKPLYIQKPHLKELVCFISYMTTVLNPFATRDTRTICTATSIKNMYAHYF